MVLRWLDLPWWQLALIVTATTAASVALSGRLPPWSKVVMSALRAGAIAAMRRKRAEMPPVTQVDHRDPASDEATGSLQEQVGLRNRTEDEIAAEGAGGG